MIGERLGKASIRDIVVAQLAFTFCKSDASRFSACERGLLTGFFVDRWKNPEREISKKLVISKKAKAGWVVIAGEREEGEALDLSICSDGARYNRIFNGADQSCQKCLLAGDPAGSGKHFERAHLPNDSR